jgi:hypothetical protein
MARTFTANPTSPGRKRHVQLCRIACRDGVVSSMLRVASSAICRHTGLAVQQGVRLTNSRVTRHIAAGTNMQSSDTAAEPQPGMRQLPDPLPVSCAPRAIAVLEYWWVFRCMCAVAACSCSMYHRHLASSVMCHGECRRFGEAFVSAPFGYMPEQRYFGLWYKGGPDIDAEIKQVCAKADVPRNQTPTNCKAAILRSVRPAKTAGPCPSASQSTCCV